LINNFPEILVQIRKHANNSTAGIRNYDPFFDYFADVNAKICRRRFIACALLPASSHHFISSQKDVPVYPPVCSRYRENDRWRIGCGQL
jgi:hypothetical protein